MEHHSLPNPDHRAAPAETDRQIKDLTLELQRMSLKLTALQQELAEAQAALAHSRAHAETRPDKLIENLTHLRDAHKRRADQLRVKLEAARKALRQSAARKIELTAQCARLHKQLTQQESRHRADIEQISSSYLTSTSWRVSAPIRVIGRFLKRRRR